MCSLLTIECVLYLRSTCIASAEPAGEWGGIANSALTCA